MARRLEPIDRPVTLQVDGTAVAAREGEPVAMALAAAGRRLLGRSVKYHRPRGASCYEGRCDGCLMRVDGVPNVMTCRTRARAGMVVETQNVLGSAERDLLAVTDWFFPRGLDHHHLFTQVRPLNQAMQKVARRISGVGRLPDEVREAAPARTTRLDVLVVGAGLAGLTAAEACARAGLRVLCVDEEGAAGGTLALFPGPVALAPELGEGEAPVLALRLERTAREAGVELRLGASAIGVFTDPPEPEVLLDSDGGVERVLPRRLVVATGTHAGLVPVPGGDLPGVLTARGAARLLHAGLVPAEEVALVGEGPWTAALAQALGRAGARLVGPVPLGALAGVVGRKEVRGVRLRTVTGEHEERAARAVVIEAPATSAFELAGQAGAAVRFAGAGFVVVASPEDGRVTPGQGAPEGWVRALGACAGLEAPLAVLAQARAAARALVRELGHG